MIKTLIFAVVGLVVGGGLGFGGGTFLFPAEEIVDASIEGEIEAPNDENHQETDEDQEYEYGEFSEQFIIPIIADDKVASIMVLSIALEVRAENLQDVFDKEPKLRSAFLQSLFNHANNGGFSGNFTQFSAMASLKRELLAIAQTNLGSSVREVLILDAVRQD